LASEGFTAQDIPLPLDPHREKEKLPEKTLTCQKFVHTHTSTKFDYNQASRTDKHKQKRREIRLQEFKLHVEESCHHLVQGHHDYI